MKVTSYDAGTQERSLDELIRLVRASISHPKVRETAIAIARSRCEQRDDLCELEALFDAVKNGTDAVPALSKGLGYYSDPRSSDFFVSPPRLMEWCERGACGEDCDSHAMLNAALAGSLGFRSGLKVYGRKGARHFEHVYAVVGVPKGKPTHYVAMDTTVDSATLGWEPPPGRSLTKWAT